MIKLTPEAYVAIKDQLGSVLHGGCIYVKDRRKLKYKANLRQRKRIFKGYSHTGAEVL